MPERLSRYRRSFTHVGTAVIFQNLGKTLSDQAVYRRDVRLARLAEPLGFESVWSVEHHFTDYTMCPDPLQFLTYMAGCTTQVKLGTMVAVLPWYVPLRFADNIQRQGIDGAIEFFMNLQVWGDPLRCRDVIIDN